VTFLTDREHAADRATEPEEASVAIRIPTRRRVARPAPAWSRVVASGAGWAAAEVEAALAVPADPTAAAFFDVDNTMMQGASIYYLARGLAARNYFTTGDLVRFAWRQLRYRLLAAENAGDMSSAKQAALAFVAGWSVTDLERLSEEIFDELMADRIWSGSHALAHLHMDAGQRVWLVTAAPVDLARVIARRLGLTGALGTVAEIYDGVYTGRLVGDLLHGPAKAEAIRTLAEAEGLDLLRCSAYSDSVNDTPMLSAVGHAVAVNPDAALRREARRRGWEVRDFRTGRKAAKVAVPAAVGTAAAVGVVTASIALRRRHTLRVATRE
jgi:HAD superfamily hydrolase (TIGR01490 family)